MSARRDDGSLICLSELPAPDVRWTRLRKQVVVECYEFGLINTTEVCKRYDMTPNELAEWQVSVNKRNSKNMVWNDRPRTRISGVVTAGGLKIDLDNETVEVGGEPAEVTPSEWRILRALAEADGAVVTNAMVMGVLYGRQNDAAGHKTADVLVCRLRRKLGDQADRVAAVWGRGYRLLK